MDETGAEVQVLRAEENPKGLDDRIVILNGTEKSKQNALAWVLSRLREHFKKRIDDPMTFVCLIPSAASPVIVGSRGQAINDIMRRTKVDMAIAKDRVRGTSDSPVTIKGRSDSIVDAMAAVSKITQGLVDNGKLGKRDFTFCKIFPSPTSKRDVSSNLPNDSESGLPAKLSVTSEEVNGLVTPDGIRMVEDIERKFACKVTIEEAVSPPQNISEEVLSVDAARSSNKADAVEAVLRILHDRDRNRSCAVLVDSKLTNRVVGHRKEQLHEISQRSKCSMKLVGHDADLTKQSFNLLECSGSFDAQISALRMVLRRIDSLASSKEAAPSVSPESKKSIPQEEHVIFVQLPGTISDEDLRKIQRSVRCEVRLDDSDTGRVELRGNRWDISKAVYELLGNVKPNRPSQDYQERHRRRPENSSDYDDEIDYN